MGMTKSCLLWAETTHLVTRSVRGEMFCMNSKGDTQEENRVGNNWSFPYLGEE